MKVLIWTCGFEKRHAGVDLFNAAVAAGYEVQIAGRREHPEEFFPVFDAYKPDFVFSFSIAPYLFEAYQRIRSTGCKLLLWYPDMTDESRDKMWRSLSGRADVLVFSILETAQRYRNLAPAVYWVPQYFEDVPCRIDGQLPQRLDPSKPIFDVCFIGSVDKLRMKWLTDFEKRYKCNFVVNQIGKPGEVRGREMAELYAQSKISFNIQRKQFINPGPFVSSNRMYRAMGCGTMFINHKVSHIDFMFQLGHHLETHNDDYYDLRNKIDVYLNNESAREKIAASGQQMILQHHTLTTRIVDYWQIMQAHLDRKPLIKPGFMPVIGSWASPELVNMKFPLEVSE